MAAERGHAVAIVTLDPFVGREIVRTSADQPLRERLRRRGVEVAVAVESAIKEWHGDGATVNAPERSLSDALAESGREVHAIGDNLPP